MSQRQVSWIIVKRFSMRGRLMQDIDQSKNKQIKGKIWSQNVITMTTKYSFYNKL